MKTRGDGFLTAAAVMFVLCAILGFFGALLFFGMLNVERPDPIMVLISYCLLGLASCLLFMAIFLRLGGAIISAIAEASERAVPPASASQP